MLCNNASCFNQSVKLNFKLFKFIVNMSPLYVQGVYWFHYVCIFTSVAKFSNFIGSRLYMCIAVYLTFMAAGLSAIFEALHSFL